jgi:hypothetical protein
VALAKIRSLIDKVDSFELVRDQLAAILLVESAEQQRLATLVGKDPDDWKLRVFLEASNPWVPFGDGIPTQDAGAGEPIDTAPIVNVWWDGSRFERAKKDPESQAGPATFNIDVYGCGVARETTSGHVPGDKSAALEAQRAARLVRNIIESAHYWTLGLNGIVADRDVVSLDVFQPQSENRTVEHVVGVRVKLDVQVQEFSPQVEGEPLELLSVRCLRDGSGQLIFRADFPFTP